MFKSLNADSSKMHMALADYLIQFRKPGDNPVPIKAGSANADGWITADEWIRWARPVWYGADWAPDGDGISETDVLNVAQARETDDERHLCPLQLGVIERAIKLWSAPGELVYSPFAGIGSEGVTAIRLHRRFVGAELKRSYWQSAVRNLRAAEVEREQGTLFAGVI
jgi:DNA modification methylase